MGSTLPDVPDSTLPWKHKHTLKGTINPVGNRSNYLEKPVMLRLDGKVLITLVDSQDASGSFSLFSDLSLAN